MPESPQPIETESVGLLAPSPFSVSQWLAIGLGGACGAVLRGLCTRWLPAADLAWAVPEALLTLGINLLGAMLLGILYGRLHVAGGGSLLRPFLGIGVLGSFTTFSTFLAEFSAIGAERGLWVALSLVLSALVLGLAAFALGDRIGGSGGMR